MDGIENGAQRFEIPDGLVERLSTLWEPVLSTRGDVIAAYLFGSVLRRGSIRDLDVGLVLRGRRLLDLAARAELAAALEAAMPLAIPIDVRDLSEEDPLFSFSVLRDGLRVYDGDRKERVSFEATVLSRFQDMAPMVRRARLGVRRRIRRGNR